MGVRPKYLKQHSVSKLEKSNHFFKNSNNDSSLKQTKNIQDIAGEGYFQIHKKILWKT